MLRCGYYVGRCFPRFCCRCLVGYDLWTLLRFTLFVVPTVTLLHLVISRLTGGCSYYIAGLVGLHAITTALTTFTLHISLDVELVGDTVDSLRPLYTFTSWLPPVTLVGYGYPRTLPIYRMPFPFVTHVGYVTATAVGYGSTDADVTCPVALCG